MKRHTTKFGQSCHVRLWRHTISMASDVQVRRFVITTACARLSAQRRTPKRRKTDGTANAAQEDVTESTHKTSAVNWQTHKRLHSILRRRTACLLLVVTARA
ncbi:hypothetical protein TRVL_09375 [Trypanosoma vivax]|nr:hypothetical protein TRVL_09375 [Trypanosoma vivax]